MRNFDIKKATYANLARKQLKSIISKVSTKQTFKTVSLKKIPDAFDTSFVYRVLSYAS
jgi:hypothetical protein